jgi:hypothetical protein
MGSPARTRLASAGVAVSCSVATQARLHLAQAALVERGAKAGDLCTELDVTRQTLHRFVRPNGEVQPDGANLLERKRQQTSS